MIEYEPANCAMIAAVMNRMRLCGCGSGTTFAIIRDMLQVGQNRLDGDFSVSFYDQIGDLSPQAVEFIAHALDSWDLLQHGSGVGGSWITDDGAILLKFLKDFGTEEAGWPDWTYES